MGRLIGHACGEIVVQGCRFAFPIDTLQKRSAV